MVAMTKLLWVLGSVVVVLASRTSLEDAHNTPLKGGLNTVHQSSRTILKFSHPHTRKVLPANTHNSPRIVSKVTEFRNFRQGDDNNGRAIVITDFLGEVQEGIQSLTSTFKDYKPNDNKKEEAITTDIKRLLKALAGTIKISKDQLSPEDEQKASGLLHDLSFSADNMLDALLDIKPEDFRSAYRHQLSEDFKNLEMFAGFLTEWVHSLLAFDSFAKDGGFWKHIIGVFDEAASTLEDPKATDEGLGSDSNHKQTAFTNLANHHKDDDKPVDIIDFIIDTRGAIIDVIKALEAYKPNNNKEDPINKAMDKLDEIFDLAHNFGKHKLNHGAQARVSQLLHDLAFVTDDLLDAVFEMREEFEHEYSEELRKRFYGLKEKGEKLTGWVGKALHRAWREEEIDYWRHVTGVFGAVGDALGDFEDE